LRGISENIIHAIETALVEMLGNTNEILCYIYLDWKKRDLNIQELSFFDKMGDNNVVILLYVCNLFPFQSWLEQVVYFYPPSINDNTVQAKINKDILVNVCLPKLGITTTKRINTAKKPNDLIQTVLRKRTLTTGIPEEPVENYCLKVVGEETYIVGDHKLIHFTVSV
jgi:hypothetical protein